MRKIYALLLFFLFPTIVFAINRYEVENYFYDVEILENGNMKVKELIILNGNIESFYKNIYYRNSRLSEKIPFDFTHDKIHNGTGLENVIVKSKELTSNDKVDETLFHEKFIPMERIYYEEDKEDKEYVEKSHQDGKELKIFYQKSSGRVAFLIEYTVLDVVVRHQDVAEIYWTFIDSEFQNGIENLMIRIHLPHESREAYLKTWIHGDLMGKISYENNQMMLAKMKKISKETAINIRMTFDTNVVSSIKKEKQTNQISFQNILELEEKKIQEEHETDKKQKQLIRILLRVSYVYVSLLLVWWVYVYFRYDKEYKYKKKEKLKIIKEYNIEIVDAFFHDEVTYKGFLCSFLNLIYKKNIRVSIWHRKNENYEFILENRDHITHTEEVLIDFLFERIGNKNKFSVQDFKNYAQEKPNLFQKYYDTWKNCVMKDTLREKFYEQNGKPIISSIFLLLFSFFILFANIYFGTFLILPWVAFTFGVSFFFYSIFIKKRTRKGNDDYYSWINFQNFLKKFDPKELEEPLELCLIYSLLFENPENVLKQKRKGILFDRAFLKLVEKEFKAAIKR